MKKVVALFLSLFVALSFCACAKAAEKGSMAEESFDFTAYNSLIAYSKMCEILRDSDRYVGATFKVKGRFVSYYVDSMEEYHASVTIEDTPNCCAVGLEFVLKGEPSCPEGYPARDEIVTIEGKFETYEDKGVTYPRLIEAEIK